MVVWASISWNFLGPIFALHGRINSKDYLNILGDHVHPIVQVLFLDGHGIFQDDNASMHSAHVVKNWFKQHGSELEHIEWPPQSLDLNIIDHLWSVLEQQVNNCYSPLSYLKKLEHVLIEE